MPDPEETLRELDRRLRKVEENQEAIDGAIRAFIVVFGIRRLPDKPGGDDGWRSEPTNS